MTRVRDQEGVVRTKLLGRRGNLRGDPPGSGVGGENDRRLETPTLRDGLHIARIEFATGERRILAVVGRVNAIYADVERPTDWLAHGYPLARRTPFVVRARP